MDVSEIIGLYNVKTILTDNSVQKLRNQKLNKTKCDFLDQIRLVRSSPDSPVYTEAFKPVSGSMWQSVALVDH